MWRAETETLLDGRGQKLVVLRDGAAIPYSLVLDNLVSDARFRSFFIGLMADAPFRAFRWETPPITTATADRDIELVLLNSETLDRPVNAKAFAAHFSSDDEVVTFSNLGGDATLVVPCPRTDESIYSHLASFIRHAPKSQTHQLWQTVGEAAQQRLGEDAVWLSTAGMGVSWLHVRLDSRPKYYGYAPYKTFA